MQFLILDDILIVNTKDALLVCKKGSSEGIKNIVGLLRKISRNEIHHINSNKNDEQNKKILSSNKVLKTFEIIKNKKNLFSIKLIHTSKY